MLWIYDKRSKAGYVTGKKRIRIGRGIRKISKMLYIMNTKEEWTVFNKCASSYVFAMKETLD